MNASNTYPTSVVVITYQSQEFIVELLESIKKQTWNEIELIVSDDASTDKTVEICSGWINKNKSRFVNTKLIVSKENTGIPSNCYRGLSAAGGEWIKCIGGDDILLENCIEDNMNAALNHPDVSLIISDLIEIDKDSNTINKGEENNGLKYFFDNQQSKKQKLKAYARWPAFLNTPTFFFKKKIIKNIITEKDLKFRIFEDTVTVFNLINIGAKFHYMKTPTIKYRIHSQAASRDPEKAIQREQEAYFIYRNYRRKYLSVLNPTDLSVLYENWLRFKYKGLFGCKGSKVLQKLSLFYWRLRLNGIKV